MAAGALAEFMGGTPSQVENAAEIGMEHNLGLTCDPVGGLDAVIKTMRDTGKDMRRKYKETSRGGLAVNVVEC
jgi:L-serine dehydratase